eukprot:410419-Prymnesium_polylepis.1
MSSASSVNPSEASRAATFSLSKAASFCSARFCGGASVLDGSSRGLAVYASSNAERAYAGGANRHMAAAATVRMTARLGVRS